MSIDMILGMAESQTQDIKNLVTKQNEAYTELQKSLAEFILQTDKLKGVTYDSAKKYCAVVIEPLVRGCILLNEEISRANENYVNTYKSEVDTVSLKQQELERLIREAESQIRRIQHLLNLLYQEDPISYSQISMAEENKETYRKLKNELEEKLRKLLAFNAKSPSFFSEVEVLKSSVDQGLAQAEKSWSPTSKTFNLPSRSDMGWIEAIEGKWLEKDYTQEEIEYKETLKLQYGFDDKIARIIIKVRKNIYNDPRIPNNEKDYVFTRLLGGLSYGHEENNFLNRFMWGNTAGLGKEAQGEFLNIKEQFKEYGRLTDSEYEYLKYKVRIQHDGYGYYNSIDEGDRPQYKETMETVLGRKITEDEFKKLWNSQIDAFKGKTDFAHQYITMATHLYGKPRLADIRGGHKNTNDMSGWFGDTTDVADTNPNIGNADYKADLDAVNIVSSMKKNNSNFITASNSYYDKLENNVYNRAEEFKKNVDFNEVKDKIYNQLIMSKRDGEIVSKPSNIDYIKRNYSQTYNFIKSVENNQNDIKNYYEER
ncbi:T7SS effector LXG polymorphic toxin [Gemella morbillorum]|uniref:T7SS effector LXG polymorphic toxin n=1 Tax=Gemella morbillorum TaxID=29391 RepID=UPI0028D2FA6A|nr:T7SS effector LXG polymorphic toxin [Gemella morbillorum]